MSGIFNGLQNLISGIQTLINGVKIGIEFVINIVKSTYQLVLLLINIVGNTTILIATLPAWIRAVATATLGVAVIYLMLGRETGK